MIQLQLAKFFTASLHMNFSPLPRVERGNGFLVSKETVVLCW